MSNQAKNYWNHFAVGALVAALGAGSYVIAAVVFSDFTGGTTISASEMNAKLNALKDAVNASAASVACPANTPARFTDKGDGTICDRDTGLMWEKKTGTAGTQVPCSTPTACTDPHNVNNAYTWSAATPFAEPTGTLFTDFLARINMGASVSADGSTITQAGYSDWRIPNIKELKSILAPCGASGPCIDAIILGPTHAGGAYWSSSTLASRADDVWLFVFGGGSVGTKAGCCAHARAVRGGR